MFRIYSVLAFILLINFLLASKMILAGDFFYLADQARDFLLTKDIIFGDHFVLIGTHSGLGGFFHGPLWLYMLVPFYLLGGGDPFTFTYFYIAICLLTVLAGYIAASKLYNYKVGLITAFLLALSPSIWGPVPNTIGVNVVPLVYIGMFYFIIKFIQGERYNFIPAIFLAGLALQFETALPLIVIPIVALTFFLNEKARKDIKLIFLSLISFVVSLSTFILFDLRHNFLMARSLLGFVGGGEREEGYMEFPQRLFAHLSSLEGIYSSTLINSNIILTLLAVSIVIVFLYCAYREKKNELLKEWWYLILFPCAVMGVYLLYPYPVWPEYLLGMTVPVVFALAVGMGYVLKSPKFVALPIALIAVSLTFAGQKISAEYTQNTTSGSYLNQKKIVEWIYQDAGGEEFSYFVYTPHTYTYGMDYLFEYLGESKYGYTPGSMKSQNTYLILAPHLSGDEGAHAFWKENVIKTQSSPSARVEFEGGTIVEKIDLSKDKESVDPNYNQELIFR